MLPLETPRKHVLSVHVVNINLQHRVVLDGKERKGLSAKKKIVLLVIPQSAM